MITKKILRQLIDNAQIELEECWDILCMLKEHDVKKDWASQVLEFQPRLAAILFRLDAMRLALHQEKKLLKSKRSGLSDQWFNRRMKTIESYLNALKEVISLCRALGDSFACFFYDNSMDQLLKHLKHEAIPYPSPGDGGLGELEFIRNIKHINGQMVLYHGITTFLRLGDISFIDLKTLSVTAIGELKTKRTGSNQLDVSLHFIGGEKVLEMLPPGPAPTKETISIDLPGPAKERFQRQMKAMVDSLQPPPPGKAIVYKGDSQIQALEEVAAKLKAGRHIYKQAGEGLLLCAIHLKRKKSLSSMMLGKSRINWRNYLSSVELKTFNIMDEDQARKEDNTNCIHIGGLSPQFLVGTLPLFWWPIPSDFLRKIFFGEVIVATIYNPAHLARKLRAVGYSVSLEGEGKLRVSKKLERGEMVMYGMDYFVRTIQDFLMDEEYIVSILSETLEDVKKGNIPLPAEIQLRLHCQFRNNA